MGFQRFQTIALSAAVALGIVAGGLALRLKVASHAASTPSQASLAKKSPVAASANAASLRPNAKPASKSNNTPQLAAISVTPISPKAAEPNVLAADDQFNHLPYEEADPARLQPAGTFIRADFERAELLDLEAANAFRLMVEEAEAQGIYLMPISGFRTVAEQQELFAKQTERYGSKAAAAQLSAPAEHSEHHTGYAIDIGDSDRPETDLDSTFADTAAYQWLLNNAYVFGFEQSFPPDNPQGLSFEPWHWRYVQSERAAQVFAKARSAPTVPTVDSTATPRP